MERKAKPDQQMFAVIYYRMRTDCQWKALPKCLGAGSTVHDRHQQWVAAGVFERLWKHGLLQINTKGALDWSFQCIDSSTTKAPLGGQQTGANPTDRGKIGTKRNLLTEARVLPISLVITAAHVHDKTQTQALSNAMPFLPPAAEQEYALHFCAAKAYYSADMRSTIRWVCERTHSWLNQYWGLLVRWEKKLANHKSLLFLACAQVVWRRTLIFG